MTDTQSKYFNPSYTKTNKQPTTHNRSELINVTEENYNSQYFSKSQYKSKSYFMNVPDHFIYNQELSQYDKVFSKGANQMIKIEYYDTLLNAQRKVDFFSKLMNKIRLRTVHKPFLLLTMFKIKDSKTKYTLNINSVLKKIFKNAKRNSFDKIIKENKNKKNVLYKWALIVGKLMNKMKKNRLNEIELKQTQVIKQERKKQIFKRSLKYFGTIMNHIIRDKKKQYFNHILLKLNREGFAPLVKRPDLKIQGNNGFIIEKSQNSNYQFNQNQNLNNQTIQSNSSHNNNNQSTKKNIFKNNSNDTGQPNESRNDSNQNTQTNIFKRNNDQITQTNNFKNETSTNQNLDNENKNPKYSAFAKNNIDSGFDFKNVNFKNIPKDEEMVVKNDIDSGFDYKNLNKKKISKNDKKVLKNNIDPVNEREFSFFKTKIDLMNEIKNEIMEINEKLNNDDAPIKIEERIDLLNRITGILGLLKNYYEQEGNTAEDEKSDQKQNFQQSLQLVKKLMEMLLKKMSDDISGSQIRITKSKTQIQTPKDKIYKKLETENQSLMKLGKITRQLTKELGFIGPSITENMNNEIMTPVEQSDVEFQSISGINNLLNDMIKKMNIVNNNVENSYDLYEDDEYIKGILLSIFIKIRKQSIKSFK